MAPRVGVTLQVIDHEKEHAAAKAMVTKLWEQWAEREGVIAKDRCPIAWLSRRSKDFSDLILAKPSSILSCLSLLHFAT